MICFTTISTVEETLSNDPRSFLSCIGILYLGTQVTTNSELCTRLIGARIGVQSTVIFPSLNPVIIDCQTLPYYDLNIELSNRAAHDQDTQFRDYDIPFKGCPSTNHCDHQKRTYILSHVAERRMPT